MIRRVPLFTDLTDNQIEARANEFSVENYAAGQVIFAEGEPGGDLLIVGSGTVRVLKSAATGRQQLLSIERPGGALGEVSVFDGGSYSASAIALEAVSLLRLRGPRFHALCIRHPELAIKVIRVLGYRLRQLRKLVEELSFSTVRRRLIAHLLWLAEETGKPCGSGVEVRLEENNEELAARLGTVRELVSRNLGRLHGEQLIVMRKRVIAIPSLDVLRSELEA